MVNIREAQMTDLDQLLALLPQLSAAQYVSGGTGACAEGGSADLGTDVYG